MSKIETSESPAAFMRRVKNALLRLGVMVLFGVAHWMINHLVPYLVPKNMPQAGVWLDDVTFAFFSLIYVYLCWDTVKVFVPKLQARDYPGTESDGNKHQTSL